MKYLKYLIAILWLLTNLVLLAGVFGYPQRQEYCPVEVSDHISCKVLMQYGWPEKIISSNNGEVDVNSDGVRTNGVILALILVPSLLGAICIRKVANRANTRN